MLIVGADPAFEVTDIQLSVVSENGPNRDAAQGRRATAFEVGDMSGFVDQQFIAGDAVDSHPHLVALRPRTREDRGFVPEQICQHRFQPIDGRIFMHHVIADFGLPHRLSHGLSGTSHGIAAKIDRLHLVYFRKSTL